ncbi:transporter substrate-binding domain-containing protein [Ensifer sp. WSM1721]|uniref:transporter substrate-binding domain-containing protein n=1 Tax=Ensifer sp. WSM1721 TaxID=1041159 RepID=UPI001FD8F432|nr:transporter substrate-binding domain-containing protein [Ensifer sp. WSM1721]
MRFGLDGGLPPFASPNPDGQLVGCDIDLGGALCAELKRKCVSVRRHVPGSVNRSRDHCATPFLSLCDPLKN